MAVGGFAIWVLTFALSFEFLRVLVLPVSLIAENYASRIIPGIAVIAGDGGRAVRRLQHDARQRCSRRLPSRRRGLWALIGRRCSTLRSAGWCRRTAPDRRPQRRNRVGLQHCCQLTAGGGLPRQMQASWQPNSCAGPCRCGTSAIADDTPSCSGMVSGTASGNQDRIKDGIASRGAPNSAAMKSSADNPGPGQIATGLMLLCFIGVFAIFASPLCTSSASSSARSPMPSAFYGTPLSA